ncbi:NADPH-dependent oxidoreductase [Loigolactobacillus backii]|uniref:NADPH-dependent oxidoreductase n=1 Tax=Loigolactobacillus backii TaxID=375175 RepID=UPI0007F17E36|nr:NADPH-dependent oxidoreductase [Loigolactobacillus backii]ANK59451.1 NADPH-dependent oxidoreductase [Loigolactobacillus backii]ANK64444.1 NADPH-dependent oxidoreductase [Loigolactobacillus backii]ANK67160.1 NADPH-dependent oxidoreductase [Loigolactobacillus backii]OLF69495.1 NADPH-flavin oxidoreductase [Loigolactobacillus backii]PIO87806.1 NADPH-dependent oxidoreductase [Loigolactobacillus backii]
MLKEATIAQQLDHRTIRAFKQQPVTAELISELVAVAQHTATSNFQQAFSVISVTDPDKKKQIAAVSNQKYVADNGHLFIFVADQHRNQQIGAEMGKTANHLGDTDHFLAAWSDASLAVQNTVVAAESLGLGAVILGSILNDAQKIIDILQLPQLTFPVLGLAIGWPDQKPQLKPRLPERFVHFENTYQLPTPVKPDLVDYDAKVHEYYDLRDANRRVDTFTNQVQKRLMLRPAKRAELLPVLRRQGFLLE